jgi:hypothetical protein
MLEGHAKTTADEHPDDEFAAYRFDAAERVAEYLRRADRLGPALEAGDLDDAAELLGHRPDRWERADEELEQLALEGDPDLEAPLVAYFHKRMLRQEALIDPVMRELRGATIQPIE